MKIVIIGGTGLIGSQVVQNLSARGHEAVPASLDQRGPALREIPRRLAKVTQA